MKRKIFVNVWERVDRPEQNKIGIYKKHKRVLREINGEYFVYLRRQRAYIGFYKDSKDVYVKYYSNK
jgi:hypothetical protein